MHKGHEKQVFLIFKHCARAFIFPRLSPGLASARERVRSGKLSCLVQIIFHRKLGTAKEKLDLYIRNNFPFKSRHVKLMK